MCVLVRIGCGPFGSVLGGVGRVFLVAELESNFHLQLQLSREIIEMPKPKQKQAPVLCKNPLPVPVPNWTRLSHISFPIRNRGSQVTVTDSGLTECVEFGSLGPSAFVFV